MKKFTFVKSSAKKKLISRLKETFGISKLPYLIIETSKRKYRAFSGSLTKEEIAQLNKATNIEIIGINLLREEGEIQLSFDSLSLLQSQINNNVIEINKEKYEEWSRGNSINFPSQPGGKVVKFSDYLVGFGKSDGEKILNYVPKERKLKTQLRWTKSR